MKNDTEELLKFFLILIIGAVIIQEISKTFNITTDSFALGIFVFVGVFVLIKEIMEK